MSDPTGSFFIYAGQYQPEAAQVLAECETPAFVAIVGKPSTYTTADGSVLTSVRPESIHIVDGDTLDRISALDDEDSNVVKAKEHYGTDRAYYSSMVLDALRSLKEDI